MSISYLMTLINSNLITLMNTNLSFSTVSVLLLFSEVKLKCNHEHRQICKKYLFYCTIYIIKRNKLFRIHYSEYPSG